MEEQSAYRAQTGQTETDHTLRNTFRQIRDYLIFLARRWWLILLITLLGAAAGYLFTRSERPQYVGKTTFIVEGEGSSRGGSYAGLAAMAGIDLGGTSVFSSENMAAIMLSRSLMGITLMDTINVDGKSTTLLERYLATSGLRDELEDDKLKSIQFPVPLHLDSLTRDENALLNLVYRDLRENRVTVAKPDRMSSLIEAKCTTPDELFSKEFPENLINNVTDFYIESKTDRLRANVSILQRKADSLARVMSSSTYGAAAAVDRNINPARAVSGAQVESQRMNASVASTAYSEVLRNLESAKVSLQRETPLVMIIDKPYLPLPSTMKNQLLYILLGAGAFFVFALALLVIVKMVRDNL